MGFFLSWEDEYRDLFLSAKETMFFFLPPCWQGFAFYNPQIEMFARFKMKSSFHKTKRII